MPHRRTVKKGSFGGHLDDLVKHFPHGQPQTKTDESEERDRRDREASIHDRLFERAWREAREETPREPRQAHE
jgi:hypothetical protein